MRERGCCLGTLGFSQPQFSFCKVGLNNFYQVPVGGGPHEELSQTPSMALGKGSHPPERNWQLQRLPALANTIVLALGPGLG